MCIVLTCFDSMDAAAFWDLLTKLNQDSIGFVVVMLWQGYLSKVIQAVGRLAFWRLPSIPGFIVMLFLCDVVSPSSNR